MATKLGKQIATDILVLYNGNNQMSFRVCALTERGTRWLQLNSPMDSWCGQHVIVPTKIIQDYADRMQADGLRVGGES